MFAIKSCCFFSYRIPSMNDDRTWNDDYWPLHASVTGEYLVFNSEHQGLLEGRGGIRTRKCAFWSSFVPKMKSIGKKKFIANDCNNYLDLNYKNDFTINFFS